jgi:hypothetical protein
VRLCPSLFGGIKNTAKILLNRAAVRKDPVRQEIARWRM